MKFMLLFFSIKNRYCDILLKKHKLHLKHLVECCSHLFCCNQTWYCVGMVSVMSASRYVTSASHYQSRSSMYIQGLITQNSTELDEAVLIGKIYNNLKEKWFLK